MKVTPFLRQALSPEGNTSEGVFIHWRAENLAPHRTRARLVFKQWVTSPVSSHRTRTRSLRIELPITIPVVPLLCRRTAAPSSNGCAVAAGRLLRNGRDRLLYIGVKDNRPTCQCRFGLGARSNATGAIFAEGRPWFCRPSRFMGRLLGLSGPDIRWPRQRLPGASGRGRSNKRRNSFRPRYGQAPAPHPFARLRPASSRPATVCRNE